MHAKEEMKKQEGPCSFLDAVAAACLRHYGTLSDICFVFPNKRSGSFFLRSLSAHLGDGALLAPEVLDIPSLMSRISGLETAPRLDLLFRLYKVYRELCGRPDSLVSPEELLEFDRFAPWGEIVLEDFSEVDKYDVDAAEIFKNVTDYRNLSSNFLTPKQLEMIERYFGYRPASADVEGFWRTVYDRESLSSLKEKFIELWRILPELYEALLQNLDAAELAMEGTVFKRAMQMVRDEEAPLPWKHIVVVGFNMLSTTESELFEALRDRKADDGEPYMSFFWDATGPVLSRRERPTSIAMRSMRLNIANFPMPEWALADMALAETKEFPPHLEIAAAPSNVAQVKIASMEVEKWLASPGGKELVNDARTAIVVPDENLLMPLIYSMPEDIENVNLTMGFSMRFTAVASFIYHLRRLQTRIRKSGGEPAFFYQDMTIFMSHPLVQAVIGSNKANYINGIIENRHLRLITLEWIRSESPLLGRLVEPAPVDSAAEEVIDHIDGILQIVEDALGGSATELRTLNCKMERSQVIMYRLALSRLRHSVRTHGIKVGMTGVYHLVDRLLAGEKIMFEGKPLKGLQVMGLLETRALDFDNVIILSMNDKVMPRRARRRTFIPDSLRRGYGLPLSTRPEELYSYYFYRLLSRARKVTLLYDSREGEGMRSGGKSRYLMQLELLYARGNVRERSYTFSLKTEPRAPQPVRKSPSVMKKLEKFRLEEGGRNLSASALMNYCACQLKFYFRNVEEINDDNPAENYINSATQGSIVHYAMQHLYFPPGKRGRYLEPQERVTLTADDISTKLADKEAIWTAVTHAVNREHFHRPEDSPEYDAPLEGGVEMVARRLMAQIEDVMRYDMRIAPIELVGGEMSDNMRWTPGDGIPPVNLRFAFDRVDIVGGRLRMVDYKTGTSKVEAEEFDDVFNGKSDAKYMIQVMLYSHLLEYWLKKEKGIDSGDIEMLIYEIHDILDKGEVVPEINEEPIVGHRQVSEAFIEGMKQTLGDIFDEDKLFMPDPTGEACLYCGFKSLCGKI